jgi:hypothetical protein
MKNRLQKVSLLFTFLFFSCESIIDCVLKIEPFIEEKNLNNGIVMQSYTDFITIGIQNRNDENYEIDSVTIEGNLPTGISSSYSYRKVTFSGTPTTAGIYNFNLTIIVRDKDEDSNNDNLCGNTVSKSYQITIY